METRNNGNDHLLVELAHNLKLLIQNCDELVKKDDFKYQLEGWYRYFEEEIEIRIESLKIEVDTLGEQFHEKVNSIEDGLKSSISTINKSENLLKLMNKFCRQPRKKTIQLTHIGSLYSPRFASIDEAVKNGTFNELRDYINHVNNDILDNVDEVVNLDKYLVDACFLGQKDLVKILLWENADIDNHEGFLGKAPILIATIQGHIEIVKHLIYKNANINAKDYSGRGVTSLLEASRYGFVGIVKLLLDNNADVNYQSYCDRTALMEASENGHFDIIKLLIEKKANVNIQDIFGVTALMLAIGSYDGHMNSIKYLIDNNADVNLKDDKGQTALFAAVISRKQDVVTLLLEHNADVNIANNEGETPLQFVMKDRTLYEGIIKILDSHNLKV